MKKQPNIWEVCVKNLKIGVFFSGIALLAFSSCSKISESIQRDIIITPDSADYTIPIVTTTNSGSALGTINSTMDLEKLITDEAPKFSISNLKSAKITSLKLKLSNPDSVNNFGNFESLNVVIMMGQTDTLTVGAVVGNSGSRATILTVPLTSNKDIKSFITSGNFRYVLTGKARTVTTKVINAKASITYSATLEM